MLFENAIFEKYNPSFLIWNKKKKKEEVQINLDFRINISLVPEGEKNENIILIGFLSELESKERKIRTRKEIKKKIKWTRKGERERKREQLARVIFPHFSAKVV